MTNRSATCLGSLVAHLEKKAGVKAAMIPVEALPIVMGLLYGGMRKKDPGEGRLRAVGRSGLTGLGTGVGMLGGGVLGGGAGAVASLLLSRLQGHDKPRAMSRANKALGIGAALGAGAGGAYGYQKSKRQPKVEETSEKAARWRTGSDFAAALGALARRA